MIGLKRVKDICGKYFFNWRWWLGKRPKFATDSISKQYGITVLIPAYNEEASIAETIESVQNQSVEIDNIVVIDDHSSDRTNEIAKEMGVRVVRTHVNQGTKAQAQQYVLERGEVKTELFVTIDGDTILDKYAIEKTLPYFNNSNTASVCGFVIPAKIKTIWERGRFIEYIFGISLAKAAQNNIRAVVVSSGCFSIFRTELVEKMGGFRDTTMAEDMDLTWEFAFNGYDIYCVQDAYCYPYDPPTMKIFIDQIDRWYRSFFQNLSLHRKNMKKNLKLAGILYLYLIENLLVPVAVIGLIIAMLYGKISLSMILGLVAVNFGVVAVVVLAKAFFIKRFFQVLCCLPSYVILYPINIMVFWRSLIREWILKTPLQTWNKGH